MKEKLGTAAEETWTKRMKRKYNSESRERKIKRKSEKD